MISFIKGRLEEISEQSIVLETGGIGYRVQASPQTISRLPGLHGRAVRGASEQPGSNEEIKIHTYMHVKEDGITLYGFLSGEEIDIFNLLILVSGIGPKVALGILGAMEPQQIMLAIISEDFAALSKAPGIGKKTAQRIVLELKDRIKSHDAIEMSDAADSHRSMSMGTNEKQDAIDALLTLGYSRSESVKVVLETALPGMNTEQIIKSSLRKLAKG